MTAPTVEIPRGPDVPAWVTTAAINQAKAEEERRGKAALPVTREQVEALVFAASATSHARGVAALTVPLGRDITKDERYLAAVEADETARRALDAVLDLAFAELEQLRAEVAR